MSDPNRLPRKSAAKQAQRYPIAAAPATPSLKARVVARIRQDGPMSFADYMAAALYEPGLGYYARGLQQVGKGGDFFTSVSVGPLFGQLLARRLVAEWQTLGQPARWRITECGAHDGRLARDILDTLAVISPEAMASVEYAIPEPLDHLRQAQRETLAGYPDVLRQTTAPDELEPLPGVVFGNELLDALPCHLVEFRNGQWQECRVTCDADEALHWQLSAIDDSRLADAVETIGTEFPDGYRTEIRSPFQEWLAPLAHSLAGGLMLWIDYGFERSDYYHPARHTGTLRTFDRHQAAEDPLDRPGEIDITAHVDFTAVAEAATVLGGQAGPLQSQGTWLTALARDWLLSQEGSPDPKAIRQFQTLTHPAQLGRSFQVMEIHWPTP